VVFLVVFLLAPTVRLLLEGLKTPAAELWAFLLERYTLNKLVWTLSSALISTALCVLIAWPTALVLSSYRFRGKAALLRASLLPFVVPAPVAGLGLLALYGNRGLSGLDLQDTAALVLLGNLFYNLPLCVRLLHAGFQRLDASQLEVARVLGASRARRTLKILLPQMTPALRSASSLTFLYTFTAFGLPLILGGEKYGTLEVYLYTLVSGQLALGQAGVLTVLQLVVTGLVVWVYTRLDRTIVTNTRARPPRERPPRTLLERLALTLALALLMLISFVPLLAVLYRAFVGSDGFTLGFFSKLNNDERGVPVLELLRNSLEFALLATLSSLTLGLLHALAVWTLERRKGADSSRVADFEEPQQAQRATCQSPLQPLQTASSRRGVFRNWKPPRTSLPGVLDLLTLLPLMTSAISVSVGYLLLYPAWTAHSGLLIAVYTLFATPLVARALLPALRRLSPSVLEAARLLGGGGPRLLLRFVLPAVLPALRGGVALALASALGEFASTLVLSSPSSSTLTVGIFERLGRPGAQNLGEAFALSSVLLALTLLCFWLLEPPRSDER